MKNCLSLLFGCLLVLVFSSLAQAQQKISVVDSLEKALSKNDTLRVGQLKTGYDKSDSERVKILYGLCYELTKISSYKKARQYGELALDIAKQIGFKTGEDRGDYYLGVLCYYQRRTDDALKYLQQAFLLEEGIGDKKIISSTYLMLGLVQVNQSNYADAMKNFELGLKLKIAINDKSGIATAYHNMGIVHYYKGDYPTALENYLKALKIREEINEKRGIAMSSNNISIIYEKQGNLKDALQNYNLALSQFKELGDKRGSASPPTTTRWRRFPSTTTAMRKIVVIR